MSRARAPRAGGQELEVTITALGTAGDGIAESGQGRLFVPSALPGERWRVRLEQRLPQGWRTQPLHCVDAVERAPPVCPHFGRCGGCRLQHLPDQAYRRHKRGRIVAALAHRGLPVEPVGELRVTPAASRRRLRLGATRAGGRLVLGLRERGRHRLEPLTVCPIACPELATILLPLGAALGGALLAPEPGEVSLALTTTGIDLLLHATRLPQPSERERLAGVAHALDLARIGWCSGDDASPEPIVTRRQPMVELSTVPVALPAGGFLQATAFGEAELARAAAAWAAGSTAAVDLYAGIGTLTFAIAAQVRRVRAVEGDGAALVALEAAARASRLGGIRAERRDLARRPLLAAEFAGCDLAVLDPPRVGAVEQVREIAAARVPKVIYAACSPETFARDARHLVDGGLELRELRPIDQFLYAAEVELVALFARPDAAKRP